jgi:DNA-binding response OmpR family regulator
MADAILVVESNSTLRRTVAQRLHLEGFAPVTVPTAREALQMLRNGVPARLIILGLTIPIVDDGTFREELRHNPAFTQIPIIVLTATGAFEAGAIYRKIIDCEEVMRLVRTVFNPPQRTQSFRIQLFL